MKNLMKKVSGFVRDEEGQGLVEYALIIALVGILLIVALTFLKDKVGNTYNNAGKYLGSGS